MINTEQTFHFDNRGMASRFVWPLTGGINQGQEQWTQLLRALSFLWRGRQFYARSVCREEKNHPSWSELHQPSVDAHQEAVKHPHTLHGVGTSLCKKLYWCYSCCCMAATVNRQAYFLPLEFPRVGCCLKSLYPLTVSTERAHTCV